MISSTFTKLNWAAGLLAKICHFTPKFLLKTMHYSLFNSYLIYACQIWGQNKIDFFRKIEQLHDKALRIINFLAKGTSINDTYENSKILKVQDYISPQNALLMKDCFDEQLPKLLINYFKKTNTQRKHSTPSASKNCVFISNVCTDTYGRNSVKFQSTQVWNELPKTIRPKQTKSKNFIIEYFLKSYHNNQ